MDCTSADAEITSSPGYRKTAAYQVKPSGTVTFLFTDIEGSTGMWEKDAHVMAASFALQEAITRRVMAQHGGYIYKMIGDAFQVAFTSATDALHAAVETQHRLLHAPWPKGGELRVRMSLHTGITEERGDDYVGPTLNRAARLLAAGYGGQILMNETTYALLQEQTPTGLSLKDLGVHHLKDLLQPEHIYQVETDDLSHEFPPLKTVDLSRVHLPVPGTPFLGREYEIETIQNLLQDASHRLITITGAGGCGKTRLAIQAAGGCQQFIDGVYFVDLVQARSMEEVLFAIASAIKFSFLLPEKTTRTVPEIKSQLLNALSGKHILLVLDNFEHVISCAHLVQEIINIASHAGLLITSRERLNLQAEWVIPLEGLVCDETHLGKSPIDNPAAMLFLQTAQRAGIHLDIQREGESIARICREVAGHPLAVEMAASWLRAMPCELIAEIIHHDVAFLSLNWQEIPDRHRSLQAVFDYSWNLLSPEERTACAQLSYFQTPFRREAALAITQVSISTIVSLMDQSMLKSVPGDRFTFHPLIRQFVLNHLEANPSLAQAVALRHADYFSSWLYQHFLRLKGPDYSSALAAIRADIHEALAAHHTLAAHHNGKQLRLSLPGLILFHEMDDRRLALSNMVGLLEELLVSFGGKADEKFVLSTRADDADLHALVIAALQHFVSRTGKSSRLLPVPEKLIDWTLQLPDSLLKGYAFLIGCIGQAPFKGGSLTALYQRCIQIFQEFGDAWDLGITNVICGDVDTFGGLNEGVGHSCYQQGLEIFTRMGNDWGRALCLLGLAEWAWRQGSLEQAYTMAQESLTIFTVMENLERMLMTRWLLSSILEELQRLDEACEMVKSNLNYLSEVNDHEGIVKCKQRLAHLQTMR